jgi:uncharacterized cupredoxin-like copper-binding protein
MNLMTPRSALVAALFASTFAGAALAAEGPPGHTHDVRAYGEPGDPKKPARVVLVTMVEKADGGMAFAPSKIQVRLGEQVRFRLANNGTLDHEFVLATLTENLKHAVEMAKNPDMEHDDPNMLRLKPQANGEIVWRFTKSGEFDFSCLIPGHRDAGMTGTIVVK